MRVMALDIGQKRIGIAISDAAQKVATPVCVLPANEVVENASSFQRLLEDWEPELLVCGLPLTLAGEEGAQASKIRKQAARISASTGVPVEFADERLSSAEARSAMRDMGYDERAMRGKLDMVAACIFLQAWLDAKAANRQDSQSADAPLDTQSLEP